MACKKASMRVLFLLLLLLLLVTEDVEGKKKGGKGNKGKGKKRNRGCNDLAQNKPVDAVVGKFATITCKSESKIFDLKVTSFNKTSCTGWQAHTLVRSNTCIGQGTCLDLPLTNSSPIIKSTNETCVGLHPDKVAVSVLCTKGLEIVKMDPDEDTAVGLGAQEGILASPSYPWQYPHSKGGYKVRFVKGSAKTFSYTLYKLDLGEGDKLQIGPEDQTYEGSQKRDDKPLHGHVTGGDVILNLTHGGEAAGDGFILCYKWADTRIRDVCKELTEPPMSLQECLPEKKKGERKNKKDGKKKDRKKKNKKRRREGKGGRRRRRKNRKGDTTVPTTIPSA